MTGTKRLVALILLLCIAGAGWLMLRPSGSGAILLSGASAEAGPEGVVVFLKIENAGGPDRLVSASSTEATATITSFTGAQTLAIPAGMSPSLSEDGAYLMLSGVSGNLSEGRLIPVTLTFESAGALTTKARLTGAAMNNGDHAMHMSHHIVGEGEPAPALSLEVRSAENGWTLNVDTENFTFDRDAADGAHVPGRGHGHVYLDGLKLQRLYGPEVTIGALPPGRYELRVTLNTNDHRTYVVNGTPVSAAVTLEAN